MDFRVRINLFLASHLYNENSEHFTDAGEIRCDTFTTLKIKLVKRKLCEIRGIVDGKLTLRPFVSSSEQIWRNVELHHLLTNRSSTVNVCRQNELLSEIRLLYYQYFTS